MEICFNLGSKATPAGAGGGTGTVTSVNLTAPAIFSVSGGPITSSGTIALSLASQTANKVWASPDGSAGAPTFRAIVAADVPTLNQNTTGTAANVTGTSNSTLVTLSSLVLPVGQLSGRSNLTAAGTDGISIANGTNALANTTGASVSQHVADSTHNGYLLQTDWTLFNNKFDLPALAAGSVLFSDGATVAQDNTNFTWDDTGKTFAIGPVQGLAGTVPFGQTISRNDTDSTGESGGLFVGHNSFHTVNSGALDVAALFESKGQADAGVSVSATAGVIFNCYRNSGPSDAGSMGFLVGAFGGAHQIGTDAAAMTDLVAGVLSQVDISQGTANKVADFYGLAGTNGGTITTGQFGIYIEPPGSGTKDNWLSGKALIGGSSYSSHGNTLKIAGDMSADISVTDAGAIAGIFNATSNTTVDGSNTTLGLQGVATATVQSGVTNDKSLAGLVFTTTRGDGTDDGTLSGMAGIENLIFQNSGAAGVTTEVFGVANILFTTQGDITNYYDLYSQRNTGAGTITNHYGIYLKNDPDTPIKNWLSGRTQIGGTSFGLNADASLDLQATDKAFILNRLDTTTRDALVAVAGMVIFNTTTNALEYYDGTTWI